MAKTPATSGHALAGLLSDSEREVLDRERRTLGHLLETLAAAAAQRDDLETLRQAAADLDDLFLLVVVGEFNAGKSALINALLGEQLMDEGVTPTTARVTLLRFGDDASERESRGVVERTRPLELLRDLAVVDTPGTNAVLRQHEELTRRFIPRADLVLFITSADRPFTESERAFVEHIRTWGKKVVFVLNKIDLLEPTEIDEQIAFVRTQARSLLGFEPEIFPVSARRAARARISGDQLGDASLWASSGLDRLEDFIRTTLDDRGRVSFKLLSPLGVAEKIAAAYRLAAQQRLDELEADLALSDSLSGQIDLYLEDMRRDFTFRLQELDNVLHRLQQRGDEFFEQTLRIGRIFDLFNQSRIQAEFEARVVADLPQEVDRIGQSVIDWMVEQDLKLWTVVTEQVERRQAARQGEGPSARLAGSFEYDRRGLLGSLGLVAREVVTRYDHRREAEALARSVREAVTQTTLIEAGAVGFGALVVALVGTAAADVTGILAGSVIAGLGLYLLPLKRRRAKEHFRRRTEELRATLMRALTDAFEREIGRSVQRVRDALAPYDRFVRTEQQRSLSLRTRLDSALEELEDLRASIQRLGGSSTENGRGLSA